MAVRLLLLAASTVFINSSSASSSTTKASIGVFVPQSCKSFPTRDQYLSTITQGISAAQSSLPSSISLVYNVYDSCTETSTLSEVINHMLSHKHHVIIGPGHPSLCETVARFAGSTNTALVSWSCDQPNLNHNHTYPTFTRTVPSIKSSAAGLVSYLGYFQWRYVALVVSETVPCWGWGRDTHYELTVSGYVVTDTIMLSPGGGVWDQVRQQVANIPAKTKAIIVCVEESVVSSTLLALHSTSLKEGNRALFLVQTHSSLNPQVLSYFPNPWNTSISSDQQLLDEVLAATFVLQTNTVPVLAQAHIVNDSQISSHYSLLYDSIQLSAYTIKNTVTSGSTLTGLNMAQHWHNVTINGLHGTFTLDVSGDPLTYTSLWDYSPEDGSFRLVLEDSPTHIISSSHFSIVWPGGAPATPDFCDFNNCDSDGLNVVVVVIIIILSLALISASVAGAWFIRRRMLMKEMERGPNKILLNGMDLVFISAKTFKSNKSLKSMVFEKPDLLKASEPSLSQNSFSEHSTGEFCDTARYNGDMVFVKELFIKSFEMKSKVRNYLKMMREMRHENINPFIGCFVDPAKPGLVWEHCSRRSLEDVIHNEDIKLDWDFKLSLLTDLVRGMRYLHGSSIRHHGTLKSGNCVIDSRWVLKVTDYGVNEIYDRYQVKRERASKDLLWTAPELLRDPLLMQKGTARGDVYSFAIVMQEIVLRGYPFCMLELEADEIIKKLKKPPPLIRPSVSQQAAPPQYIQIMKQCWAEMPDMRPDFEAIHQQFKDINKGKKLNIVDTMFKMLEKYSNDLEDIVKERTVQLEEEKKKTENLLSEMLPPSVAKSLMMGHPVDPETFEEVTIYFSDIVGFTTISAMSTPMQVVDLLNDLYTMFDSTIDDYDVYKVETIGDAYMVVSGLPKRNGDRHAGEISTLSLDLLSQCGSFRIRHLPDIPLRLRIGLHTGSCVSGVVGLRMPRYCLFGDTVNTASRMESTGAPFRVHVSNDTKTILDHLGGYNLQYRGQTELKGKGIHKTWWLLGKEGFEKPMPEPPPLDGKDNHGLGSVMASNQTPKTSDPSTENENPRNISNTKNTSNVTSPTGIRPKFTPRSSKESDLCMSPKKDIIKSEVMIHKPRLTESVLTKACSNPNVLLDQSTSNITSHMVPVKKAFSQSNLQRRVTPPQYQMMKAKSQSGIQTTHSASSIVKGKILSNGSSSTLRSGRGIESFPSSPINMDEHFPNSNV